MHVWMMLELLVPRVQHAEESNLCPEVLGIASNRKKGLGAGSNQQIINYLFVLQGQRGEFVGQSEHHMDVADGQKLAPAGFEPAVANVRLALWAVPASTGIVGDGAMPAPPTFIDMTAECGCAAALDCRRHLRVQS